ncbi:MAG: hypothetical protein ACI9G1_005530 [Pirellulaceae bacterium]|jgi:hypothetical protein
MLRSNLLTGLVLIIVATPCLAEDTQEERNAKFMQAKLTIAQTLLEGLALEDYDAIEKNAQRLSLLSLDSTWKVFQTPEYIRQSAEFRRTTDAITKSAEKKNLDGAALYYMEMTMKCIQCHKYVRSTEAAKLRSVFERAPVPNNDK